MSTKDKIRIHVEIERENKRKLTEWKEGIGMREQVERLVLEGIEKGDYNLIREAMNLCSDESGVFMAEDEEYVMIDDDIFYFNGAF